MESFIPIPIPCNEFLIVEQKRKSKVKHSNFCKSLIDVPRSRVEGNWLIDDKFKAPIKKLASFNKISHSSLPPMEIINLVEEVFQKCDACTRINRPSFRSTRLAHRWKDRSIKRANKEYSLLSFFHFDDKFQTPLRRNLFVQPWNFPFADINHDLIIDRGWKVLSFFYRQLIDLHETIFLTHLRLIQLLVRNYFCCKTTTLYHTIS